MASFDLNQKTKEGVHLISSEHGIEITALEVPAQRNSPYKALWVDVRSEVVDLSCVRLETISGTPLKEERRTVKVINCLVYFKQAVKVCVYERSVGLDHCTKKEEVARAISSLLREARFNMEVEATEIASRLFPQTTLECWSFGIEIPSFNERPRPFLSAE